MIKINKPGFVESDRFVKIGHQYFGIHKWKVYELKIISDFINFPEKFSNNDYSFGTGYEVFREQLIKCQGNKCCYCEKPVHNGQIEHYRPKASYKQAENEPIIRPGYFFLAFRWINLFISCGECNSNGQKGILFPVIGTLRATSYRELAIEAPIIINPSIDVPEDHISFNEDIPIKVSDRGQLNIDIFKLVTRGDLNSIRRDKYMLYRSQKLLLSLDVLTGQELLEAKQLIKNSTKFNSPFSGMIRANIKKGNL